MNFTTDLRSEHILIITLVSAPIFVVLTAMSLLKKYEFSSCGIKIIYPFRIFRTSKFYSYKNIQKVKFVLESGYLVKNGFLVNFRRRIFRNEFTISDDDLCFRLLIQLIGNSVDVQIYHPDRAESKSYYLKLVSEIGNSPKNLSIT